MSGQFVWGIDAHIAHISFAFAALDYDGVEVESLFCRTDSREGERLAFVASQVRSYARQAAALYPPACVWVEQPSGKFQKPQLVYAVGVIQATLFDALGGVPVWSITSGDWKRRAVGYGNASKQQIEAWARDQRFVFDGQDEADAIGVAVAGRTIWQTKEMKAAA